MKIENVPFCVTDWDALASERAEGKGGFALSKVVHQGNTRLRQVEYSAMYRADHWCRKGHILFVLEGELVIEQADGQKAVLKKGMGFQVGDNVDDHIAYTADGARVLIVD